MMSLEDTVGLSRLGLTVFKVHVVCTRYVGGGSSSDLGHDGRSSSIGINVGALDKSLLVGGATLSAPYPTSKRQAY
jgi:hypothetical protein